MDLALGAAAEALIHPLHDLAEERSATVHIVGKIMVEMVADGRLDEARRFEAGQTVLGLALKMRVPNEDAEHQFDAVHDVVRCDVLGLLVADQVAEASDALAERGSQSCFVGATIGSWDGVAIIALRSFREERPGDRPFGAALTVGKVLPASEGLVGDRRPVAELLGEMVGEAAWELEDGVFGDVGAGEGRVAPPANFDARKQICLGSRQPVEPIGREGGVGAENLQVRREGDGRSATVWGRTHFLERRGCNSPRKI